MDCSAIKIGATDRLQRAHETHGTAVPEIVRMASMLRAAAAILIVSSAAMIDMQCYAYVERVRASELLSRRASAS